MADQSLRALERSAEPRDRATLFHRIQRTGVSYGEAMQRVYGFGATETEDRETWSDQRRIQIDGERYTITSHRRIGYGDLVQIETDGGRSFILSENAETAGEAAAARWRDMAENDQEEFACIVGNETLIAWALGNAAGPGSTKVNSLEEWFDVVADHPEEEWASYDGDEGTVERVGKLCHDIGYRPTVAYRSN